MAEDPFGVRDAAGALPRLRFASGSATIRLILGPPPTEAESQSLSLAERWQIELAFGDRPAPGPATEPNAPYPPDPGYLRHALAQSEYDAAAPLEGNIYTGTPTRYNSDKAVDWVERGNPDLGSFSWLVDGFGDPLEVLNDQLALQFNTNELFGSWCGLQTADSCAPYDGWAYHYTVDSLTCEVESPEAKTCNGTLSEEDITACDAVFDDFPPAVVDCTLAGLCDRCECWSTGCTWDPEFSPPFELRLQRTEDGDLVGVFDGLAVLGADGYMARPGTVRFRRAGED